MSVGTQAVALHLGAAQHRGETCSLRERRAAAAVVVMQTMLQKDRLKVIFRELSVAGGKRAEGGGHVEGPLEGEDVNCGALLRTVAWCQFGTSEPSVPLARVAWELRNGRASAGERWPGSWDKVP